MDAARALYAKAGFREVCSPQGATGHHGCDRFFAREL
jgi:putative acetyltransferase